MMDILNEELADRIVRENLSKKKKVEKVMSKFLLDENGTLYIAHSFEKVTPEEVAKKVAEAQSELDEFAKLNTLAAQLSTPPAAPQQPAAPAVPAEAPAQPQAPVDQNAQQVVLQ